MKICTCVVKILSNETGIIILAQQNRQVYIKCMYHNNKDHRKKEHFNYFTWNRISLRPPTNLPHRRSCRPYPGHPEEAWRTLPSSFS